MLIAPETADGAIVGVFVGLRVVSDVPEETVGAAVRPAVGLAVGATVGPIVGAAVGSTVGVFDGSCVGVCVGINVGMSTWRNCRMSTWCMRWFHTRCRRKELWLDWLIELGLECTSVLLATLLASQLVQNLAR